MNTPLLTQVICSGLCLAGSTGINPLVWEWGYVLTSCYMSAIHHTTLTVTGEANFSMDVTSLTVGGFNQPAVARSLIELPGNAEKGLSQRFIWLYPKPVYGKFDTLEPVREEFTEKIGNYLLWYRCHSACFTDCV